MISFLFWVKGYGKYNCKEAESMSQQWWPKPMLWDPSILLNGVSALTVHELISL